ncbi:7-cyano-7-deazaguanine synthase [Carbonactinospora thermoautotrophica]|uniref:7-cyano-7-deazaguanine synthase n=1 Tax=Carbonactinospora thermoautotrophica TaxID=1469144 RepID=A0A132MIR6_9ACTN|nr:7-cyano-7-deazaguanine synthase QueC [Carbonactinospora thermoautotrophica]KWW97750.1 7-cyano-7-deazaguanine synthase [Carbonactinospora thermoautotrophica]KWX06237.1 7-cyano-7-deazaguanine synthase [Carbonactinospora thermoautotrophica]
MTGQAPRHAVVIASGGLDSTAVAYWLADQGSELLLVSFDYGQRHRIELDHARRIAETLNARHEIVDLTSVGRLLTGSALTDANVPVPDGHYTDVSMRSTVVPNRNALMLDVAVGAAVAAGADAVALGIHAGDHPIYPDCRPAFLDAYARLAKVANEGFLVAGFRVLAPFLCSSKADIVRTAAALGVPFELTWSCYKGGPTHCGVCGTCTERREAFTLAGVPDPTTYASAEDAEVSR